MERRVFIFLLESSPTGVTDSGQHPAGSVVYRNPEQTEERAKFKEVTKSSVINMFDILMQLKN